MAPTKKNVRSYKDDEPQIDVLWKVRAVVVKWMTKMQWEKKLMNSIMYEDYPTIDRMLRTCQRLGPNEAELVLLKHYLDYTDEQLSEVRAAQKSRYQGEGEGGEDRGDIGIPDDDFEYEVPDAFLGGGGVAPEEDGDGSLALTGAGVPGITEVGEGVPSSVLGVTDHDLVGDRDSDLDVSDLSAFPFLRDCGGENDEPAV